jgi:hypothetical protein
VLEPTVTIASLAPVSQPHTTEQAEGIATLDERDRELLDFEREAWKLRMSKERAIRERFGFSAARYHQLLNRAIGRPAALSYDPMLVRRLQRIRDARRRKRVAGRLGVPL